MKVMHLCFNCILELCFAVEAERMLDLSLKGRHVKHPGEGLELGVQPYG
jgi:hypothetical protein